MAIYDFDSVVIKTWSIGAQIPTYLGDGRRLIWTPMWNKPSPETKFYTHPISGLYAILDLYSCQVVAFDNEEEQIALPQTPGPYR